MEAGSGIAVEHHRDDVWTVTLRGEHDVATAPQINGALDDLFAQGTQIILDLSEASFIDSTVLHAIVRGANHADEEDGRRFVVVAARGSFPRHLMQIVALAERVRIFGDLEAALAAVGIVPAHVYDGGLPP